MKNDLNEWLTIREAAQKLRLNEKTVRRQIWRGEIQATKKGTVYLIDPDEFTKIKVRPAHGPKRLSN